MAVSVRNFIESLFHNIWNVNSILILIVSASKSLSQARKIEHGDVGYTVKNRNCSPLNAFSVYGIIGSRLDGDQIRLSISVFTGIITITRRFAELELYILMIKILQRFKEVESE